MHFVVSVNTVPKHTMDKNANIATASHSVLEGQGGVINNQALSLVDRDPSPRQRRDNNPEQPSKKLGFSIEDILRRNSNKSPTSNSPLANIETEERDSAPYVTSADERCLSRDPEEADMTFEQHSDDDDCLLAGGDEVECGEGYSWLHCTRYKPPKLPSKSALICFCFCLFYFCHGNGL